MSKVIYGDFSKDIQVMNFLLSPTEDDIAIAFIYIKKFKELHVCIAQEKGEQDFEVVCILQNYQVNNAEEAMELAQFIPTLSAVDLLIMHKQDLVLESTGKKWGST